MKKILFIALILLLPTSAHAAEFHFDYPKTVVAGETIVSVKLNTQGESINAVSGTLFLPEGVEVSNILTGSSMISLWIEMPKIQNSQITFSGITPGGIRGDVEVFSIVLGKAGTFTFEVRDAETFKNDESGTSVQVSSKKASVTVLPGSGKSFNLEDSVSPELFVPLIGESPDLYEGAPFVSFLAQDKESGIKGYEWASTVFLSPNNEEWASAQTPLLIPKTSYASKIYIKAIDNAGNERIVVIAAPYRYAAFGVGGILMALAIVLCVLSFLRRRS